MNHKLEAAKIRQIVEESGSAYAILRISDSLMQALESEIPIRYDSVIDFFCNAHDDKIVEILKKFEESPMNDDWQKNFVKRLTEMGILHVTAMEVMGIVADLRETSHQQGFSKGYNQAAREYRDLTGKDRV